MQHDNLVINMKMKGISPLIATVLLIAFTMAVAAILTSWATSFTKTETTLVGGRGETQIKCTYGDIAAKKSDVVFNFTSNPAGVNVTTYNRGSEDLYNFSFFIITDKNVYPFTVTTNFSKTSPLSSGITTLLISANSSGGAPPGGEKFEKLRIIALCQTDFRISHEIDMS